jgi:hypothetical protein
MGSYVFQNPVPSSSHSFRLAPALSSDMLGAMCPSKTKRESTRCFRESLGTGPAPGKGLAPRISVRFGVYSVCLAAAFACGARVDESLKRGGDGLGFPMEAGVPSAAVSAWAPQVQESVVLPAASSAKPVSTFVDVGCGGAVTATTINICNVFGETSGCFSDEACVPFVDYPNEACKPEIFGTRCIAAGKGVQGDPCSTSGCADGFLCVATGHGTRCAELCPLPGEDTCPPGLLCGGVDIEGYGVCF